MPEQIPKHRGFLHFSRSDLALRPTSERVKDFREVQKPFNATSLNEQSSRCMDCGIPYCQSACPLGNSIPDWNELTRKGEWEKAYQRLRATNNFPEFTGRICPAPCESACVLGLIDKAVTIEYIERSIVEKAFENGYERARDKAPLTGKNVAIIGSGPAGLAAADQLNSAGHSVVVFERHSQLGGLLRYGIPDFKLEKWIVDRRVNLLEQEGIEFKTGVEVGVDLSKEDLTNSYDAVVMCCGATDPRDLPIAGRELSGVHFAWDFLSKQNQLVSGEIDNIQGTHSAKAKSVIVIGGGDTGSDCIGTSNRQAAKSIVQFEIASEPPKERPESQPWPFYPMLFKETSSHQEGAERRWSIMTKRFLGRNGRLAGLETVNVERQESGGFLEIENSTQVWPCELVLLAIGYTGPNKDILDNLDVELSTGINAKASSYHTSDEKIFAAGDMRRGQSLVVWAIREGRDVASKVDAFLMGRTSLPLVNKEKDLVRV